MICLWYLYLPHNCIQIEIFLYIHDITDLVWLYNLGKDSLTLTHNDPAKTKGAGKRLGDAVEIVND